MYSSLLELQAVYSVIPGFLEALAGEGVEMTVVALQVSSAVGAASLGARAAGNTLPLNFADNTRLLFNHKPL